MLQKISGIEKCQEERERGGASRLSLENLLSHSTEKIRRGNLCFRKFLVSKIVKDKRERGASQLSFENLLSHNTEKLRGETCVAENFWYRKI